MPLEAIFSPAFVFPRIRNNDDFDMFSNCYSSSEDCSLKVLLTINKYIAFFSRKICLNRVNYAIDFLLTNLKHKGFTGV